MSGQTPKYRLKGHLLIKSNLLYCNSVIVILILAGHDTELQNILQAASQ